MFEHLLRWLEHFDPFGVLYSFVESCYKLLLTSCASRESCRSNRPLDRLSNFIGLKTWTFYVPESCGWRGIEIQQLLSQHGIPITSRGFAYGDVFFNVKLSQAEWAEYVMLRAGVPLKYGLYSNRNERCHRQVGAR